MASEAELYWSFRSPYSYLGAKHYREISEQYDLDAEIFSNQDALESAGHWGVPCLVFEGEPFHGQDRIEMAVWRMKGKGLHPRK